MKPMCSRIHALSNEADQKRKPRTAKIAIQTSATFARKGTPALARARRSLLGCGGTSGDRVAPVPVVVLSSRQPRARR